MIKKSKLEENYVLVDNVIKTFNFEEDAKEVSNSLNKNKPFGDKGFPRFLIHK